MNEESLTEWPFIGLFYFYSTNSCVFLWLEQRGRFKEIIGDEITPDFFAFYNLTLSYTSMNDLMF